MANAPKLLSGRVPVTPYANLTSDRYQFLGLNQAEPSLGGGNANSVLTLGTGNTRVWSNSVVLTSVAVNGTTNLNYVGNITITGGTTGQVLTTDGAGHLSWTTANGGGNTNPGGSDTQLQYNNAGTFGGIPTVTWNGSTLSLGDVSAVSIGGGVPGSILSTDGVGDLQWIQSNSTPGGSNTQVQFNDSSTFGGNTNFTYNKATSTLNINGNVVANSVTIGSGALQFSKSNVYFATTLNSTPMQTILSTPATGLAAVEYTIVSTDTVANIRNFVKVAAVVIGNSLNYTEYSTLPVNGYIGEFFVNLDTANANVLLQLTPQSGNLMNHKLMLTTYKV